MLSLPNIASRNCTAIFLVKKRCVGSFKLASERKGADSAFMLACAGFSIGQGLHAKEVIIASGVSFCELLQTGWRAMSNVAVFSKIDSAGARAGQSYKNS